LSGDDADETDQRRSVRVPVRLIVDYEDAEDFLGDYTENLSSGGTFIHTSRALERDSTIQLVLSFPGLLQPITLEGIVRWSRGDSHPGVGVEFLHTRDYDKLHALVALIQAGDPRAVARVIRVLVAEDNPHVSGLICTGLGASARRAFGEALQFTFATAENGASALELLRTSTFDLAIIDLLLPLVDGVRVIGVARTDLGLASLPIIAISGGDDAVRSSALAAGANRYLSKPMRLRDVLESMRDLVPLA
jgi:two-component system chemotaxis response regulator CheY